MNRNRFNPIPVQPAMLWFDLALKTWEMLLASSHVIGERTQRMARAGHNPSARDRTEFTRMGSEKVQAATESGLAVATRLATTNYAAMSSFGRQWMAAMNESARLASAALAPVHRTATANSRRLGGARRGSKATMKGS